MAQPVARHGHSYTSERNGHVWQPRRDHERQQSGFEEKLQDIFRSKDELPMYKDKPYNYAAPRRKPPVWRRRRFVVAVIGAVVVMLYLSGLFSASSGSPAQPKPFLRRKTAKSWEDRRERVRQAFKTSWKAYETYAWGYDEYHPVSKGGEHMVPGGLGWIIIDALDTMMLMNLTTELSHARSWVAKELDYEKDHDVNTFETTIRMLGGLLSAHYLSTKFPDMAPISDEQSTGGADLYIEKATDLANRLTGAYNSTSGVPFASINLKTRQGIPSHADGGASSTAEAATVQLEMKYLAKLTGERVFWRVAEKVMKVIDDNGMKDGLLPIFIYANEGTFRGENIRLGSRGDSYYEYLIKQYLQTSKLEPVYLDMWNEALDGVRKNLITYSKHSNLTILGERPNGLSNPLLPKMDHLVCFMPGTIALGATGGLRVSEARKSPSWGKRQEDDMELARQLMKTCWAMYQATRTGLAAEITHFFIDAEPALMKDGVRRSPEILSDAADAEWRQDIDIHGGDVHNLLRPETLESLFYMWRITEDEKYREWGWKMFESFEKHAFVSEECGFSSIVDVTHVPSASRDNMESFWLAETLKYFYLLFGPNDILPLDQVVFNTEAHPLPRFELGLWFRTGWTRKARDKEGNIIKPQEQAELQKPETGKVQDAPAKGNNEGENKERENNH